MKLTLKQWGGSLAVRLPKKHLDLLKMKDGDCFEVVFKDSGFELLKESFDSIPDNIKEKLFIYQKEEQVYKITMSVIEVYKRLQSVKDPQILAWILDEDNLIKLEKAWASRRS